MTANASTPDTSGPAGLPVGAGLDGRATRRYAVDNAGARLSAITTLIAAARRRIRRRRIARGATIGAWVGVGLAVAVLAASRLWWWAPLPPAWALALALLVFAAGIGAAIGAARRVLGERELALLVDRAMGTDEALVTLLHLERSGADLPAVRADLERRVAELPGRDVGVPSQAPRHARWLPLAALVAALILLIPARPPLAPAVGPTAQEAERLAEALEKNEALPAEIKEDLRSLIADLEDGALSEEEAEQRLRDIQEALRAFDESMADAKEDLDALEDAADALTEAAGLPPEAEKAAEQLAEALEQGDAQAAADAANKLAEAIENATPEQAAAAGQALSDAGDALSKASNPDLRALGDSLSQAGEGLAPQQGDGQGGPPSAEARQQAADKLRDAAGKLSDNRALSERLKQDRERMRQSQEANGALEASRQRLGGEPSAPGGEAGEAGEGEGGMRGEGGTGLDAAMQGPPDTSEAGRGHTWEDQGTFDNPPGFNDADRTSARNSGKVLDDFESFYDPQRLDGAEGLIVSVEGMVDERGHFDAIERRLTNSSEKASRPMLDVPDVYTDAAERALTDDRVPPAYRAAIKDYFDSME